MVRVQPGEPSFKSNQISSLRTGPIRTLILELLAAARLTPSPIVQDQRLGFRFQRRPVRAGHESKALDDADAYRPFLKGVPHIAETNEEVAGRCYGAPAPLLLW
jgi:hypothetical protein